MLTIWDSLFLSSFIPPNLWDNKKEDVNSSSPIFFLIILILPYWNSKWKCIYLVNFRCFSGVFQTFFRWFSVFFLFFFVRKALFYKDLYFFVENCRFMYFMKLFSLISYDTILTRWWVSFQLSFSVLFSYLFRSFSVPFGYHFS